MPAKNETRWDAYHCEWYIAPCDAMTADVVLVAGLDVAWRETEQHPWSDGTVAHVDSWDHRPALVEDLHGACWRLRLRDVRPADWRELNEAAELQLEADKAQQDCCASQCAACVGDWR